MVEIISQLTEIGFNKLEAEVYLYLLANPPATAYRIGKQINKPTANVYKAIESLAIMGAVVVEDNKTKLCKSVDSNEFIGHYERALKEKTKTLKSVLQNIKREIADEKTYSINSVPLVFERFRTMMDRCNSIAVVDAFPKALERVVDSIEAATSRGVEVYVEAYQPIKIKGADVVCASIGEKALSHWKSQQLNLIIDGEENLIALMDNNIEIVKQATWSSNTYLSCLLHAGTLKEQTVMKIMAELDTPDFAEKTKMILERQKFFFNTNISGFNKLFNNESNM